MTLVECPLTTTDLGCLYFVDPRRSFQLSSTSGTAEAVVDQVIAAIVFINYMLLSLVFSVGPYFSLVLILIIVDENPFAVSSLSAVEYLWRRGLCYVGGRPYCPMFRFSFFLCSFVDDVIDAHYLVISSQFLFQLFVIDVVLLIGFLLLIGR